jgi:hypothetical protein
LFKKISELPQRSESWSIRFSFFRDRICQRKSHNVYCCSEKAPNEGLLEIFKIALHLKTTAKTTKTSESTTASTMATTNTTTTTIPNCLTTNDSPDKNAECRFPWKYNGKTLNECTDESDPDGK